jgi:hypothetical protein
MRGDRKLARRPYEGPGRAHTCALVFVFADNDVFSDPSSCPRGDRIDPSIHDVRFAAAAGAGRKHVFRDRFLLRRGFGGFALDLSCEARRAEQDGGARRVRTDDLMLAKHALYQLSYGPSSKRGRLAGSPVCRGVVDPSVRPRCHTKCGGPRQTRTADLTLIRRVL